MLINSPNISGSLTVTGNATITGSLTVAGGINAAITGSATTASYVEYSNVANKPTLVSGSEQVSFNGIVDKPTLVSGSEQISFNGIVDKPTLVSGSSQVTYSGLSGIPSGIVSGSAQITALGYATTGSNTFQASQVITGSLFISQNLVVAGSSSIQYISSSVVDIADNIITVNAFNPGVRFGGLAVADSGSSPRVSGSILFDSIKDQWIFVHESSATTSSVLLMGPETYNDLGNETYLSANRLPKGTGIEHLRDSNILDTGTVVSVNSNTAVTGSFTVVTGSAVELQVTNTGVNIGSIPTDNHNVTGSLRVTGSMSVAPSITITGDGSNDMFKAVRSGTTRVVIKNGVNTLGINTDTINNPLTVNGGADFSGNVGVGVTSPGYRLVVNSATDGISAGISGNTYGIRFDNGGTFSSGMSTIHGVDNTLVGSYQPIMLNGSDVRFGTSATERMRITSGGNVGIGTTSPENYGSTYTTLTLNNASIGSYAVFQYGGVSYGQIGAESSNFVLQAIGSSAMKFTTNSAERMRITSGGNVGINESSPSSMLHFSRQTTWGSTDNRIININNTGTGGDINVAHNMGSITWYSGNSTPTAEIAAYRNTPASGNNIELRFYTANAGTPSERMRITSTGAVSLTGPSISMDANPSFLSPPPSLGYGLFPHSGVGLGISSVANGITFWVGSTPAEYMRITSSGAVGIGLTNPGAILDVSHTAGTTNIIRVSNGAGNYRWRIDQLFSMVMTNASNVDTFSVNTAGAGYFAGTVLLGTQSGSGISTGSSTNQGVDISSGVIAIQTNNNSNLYLSKATGYTSGDFTAHFVNGNYVGGISTNGSSTNYATASDYRLKQDLKDFEGTNLINKIKTYDYEWKIDNTRMFGVIAHELQEILPYAVTGEKDAERMQAVDYSKLVPVLVKAIQEQQSQIEILKAKIEILEQS
jgi:hypothetical protein